MSKRNTKNYLILFICWIFSNILYSQSNKWTHYWSGFDNNLAYEGDFVWLGQVFGLSRQNLKTGEVKLFRPNVIQADSANYFGVNDMLIAPDSIKWLTTNRSLVRFDEKNNSWQYIKYPNQISNFISTQNIRIDKDGNIWSLEDLFIDFNGRQSYHNLHCYSPTENRWIQSIVVEAASFEIDSNNIIWLANQKLIRKFDGNSISIIAYNDRLKNGSLLAIDHQNNIWFGGRENQGSTLDSSFLYRYDGQNLSSYRMPFSYLLPQRVFGKIGIDSLNKVYLTADSAIYRFDGSSWDIVNRNFPFLKQKDFFVFDSKGRPIYHTTPNGAAQFYVTDSLVPVRSANRIAIWGLNLFEDKNSNKWFFSSWGDKYVKMIDSTTFVYNNLPIQLRELGTPFQDSSKNYWIFRNEYIRSFNDTLKAGVFKFDGTRFDSLVLPRMANSRVSFVRAIENNPTNRIIFGMTFQEFNSFKREEYLMEYKNGEWIRLDTLTAIKGNEITKLGIDSRYNLWFQSFSTREVLMLNPQGQIRTLQSLNPPFNYTNISGYFFDRKGNNWLFNRDSGLIYKYNGTNWQIITTPQDSVTRFRIDAITDDADGNIWLTSEIRFNLPTRRYTTGLSKFDGLKWKSWLKNETEFLFASKIYIDKNKLVWLNGGGTIISILNENGVERRVSTVDLDNSLTQSIIFPNPMSEEATITLKGKNTDGGIGNGLLSIFDLNGRLVCQKKFNDNQVTIRRNELQQNGLYIYLIEKEGKFSIGKILLQ